MADPVVLAIPEADITARVAELGRVIADDFEGRRPVVVGVLMGSLWFLSDLVRNMEIDLDVDFLLLNRFGEGGRIRIQADTAVPLTDRHVLLVEDIVDTGLSLTVLRRMIEERGAASVSCAALLDKTTRRITDVSLEYRGFEVGDEFLLGYGLDDGGRFRNLRDLWSVLDLAAFREAPDAFAQKVFGAG